MIIKSDRTRLAGERQLFQPERRVLLFAFNDLDERIDWHIAERLCETGAWPENRKGVDF